MLDKLPRKLLPPTNRHIILLNNPLRLLWWNLVVSTYVMLRILFNTRILVCHIMAVQRCMQTPALLQCGDMCALHNHFCDWVGGSRWSARDKMSKVTLYNLPPILILLITLRKYNMRHMSWMTLLTFFAKSAFMIKNVFWWSYISSQGLRKPDY